MNCPVDSSPAGQIFFLGCDNRTFPKSSGQLSIPQIVDNSYSSVGHEEEKQPSQPSSELAISLSYV